MWPAKGASAVLIIVGTPRDLPLQGLSLGGAACFALAAPWLRVSRMRGATRPTCLPNKRAHQPRQSLLSVLYHVSQRYPASLQLEVMSLDRYIPRAHSALGSSSARL